ncbi:MAG: hypothetical protein IPP69_08505 [Flavobacteriales bacterium]|nr:hypothetical protein [Flavobacteriales bacterium]
MTEIRKTYRSGWRNNYRSSMPAMERWSKDIRFALIDLVLWMRNGFRLPVMVVYPDFPSKKTTIFKIAKQLGYRLTNKPIAHADVVIYFDNITTADTNLPDVLLSGKEVVNIHCTDISKVKVDEIHLKVFGYNTFIDPLSYTGKAVQKSDINALHDGKIIQCPIDQKQHQSVYQVLIDNTHDESMVLDYRVPIYDGLIPLLYRKFKSYEKRFTNDVTFSELVTDVRSVFTEKEEESIVAFTQSMQVEFCELDILRNKDDGRIYIIDVNKTPYGPPAGLKPEEREEAVIMLTAAFRARILSKFSRIN